MTVADISFGFCPHCSHLFGNVAKLDVHIDETHTDSDTTDLQ